MRIIRLNIKIIKQYNLFEICMKYLTITDIYKMYKAITFLTISK